MEGGLGSPLLGCQPQHRAGHSSQEAREWKIPTAGEHFDSGRQEHLAAEVLITELITAEE